MVYTNCSRYAIEYWSNLFVCAILFRDAGLEWELNASIHHGCECGTIVWPLVDINNFFRGRLHCSLDFVIRVVFVQPLMYQMELNDELFMDHRRCETIHHHFETTSRLYGLKWPKKSWWPKIVTRISGFRQKHLSIVPLHPCLKSLTNCTRYLLAFSRLEQLPQLRIPV